MVQWHLSMHINIFVYIFHKNGIVHHPFSISFHNDQLLSFQEILSFSHRMNSCGENALFND